MSQAYEGTLRWFGRPFDSPMYEDMPETAMNVVGMNCALCQEPILEGEPGVTMPHVMALGVQVLPQHIECNMRSIIGSPAHMDGLCYCNSGEQESGSGLTYRQEAQQVIERLWGKGWRAQV